MTQTICDICGEPITSDGRSFKIKECLGLFEGGFFWETIDAHDKCVRMLIEAKKEREKEKNNG